MPDDYYVSQYSGEEIDDLLSKAGTATGAVRYDAAQSLADEQKTQARGNIDAAPNGYGLGAVWNVAPSRDADLITGSGFQMAVLNTPTGNSWWGILSFIYDADTATQWAMPQNTAAYYGSVCKREKRAGTWTPWEWVNPPLALGVEYRTTECYLGKPVYVKKVDFGNAPASGSKTVSCATSVSKMVDFDLTVWNGAFSQKNTIINDDGTLVARPYIKLSGGTLEATLAVFADISTRTVDLVVKYTKATD